MTTLDYKRMIEDLNNEHEWEYRDGSYKHLINEYRPIPPINIDQVIIKVDRAIEDLDKDGYVRDNIGF